LDRRWLWRSVHEPLQHLVHLIDLQVAQIRRLEIQDPSRLATGTVLLGRLADCASLN